MAAISSSSEMSPARSEEVVGDSVVMCRHRVRASLYTSWTMGNPGQTFFRCGYWERSGKLSIVLWVGDEQGNDCAFFQCYGPPCFGREKEIHTFGLKQRNSLKEKVKVLKDLNNKVTHKWTVINEKCEKMETLNIQLQGTIEELTKWKKMLQIKILELKKELRLHRRKSVVYFMLIVLVVLYVLNLKM
ncbi:hypothetical protein P3X46_004940 [Hevea brasiliensis]|uniref:Zinc finger GRF-type domain-containing protein n=1 Tax=Hevea brasiliensis TaxID=3981 RepID=A0ABQ9MYA3_HEVBR|nr:hypothetical protein P3X46_004940 [Hevea brasiliensis]